MTLKDVDISWNNCDIFAHSWTVRRPRRAPPEAILAVLVRPRHKAHVAALARWKRATASAAIAS